MGCFIIDGLRCLKGRMVEGLESFPIQVLRGDEIMAAAITCVVAALYVAILVLAWYVLRVFWKTFRPHFR